MSSVEDKPDPNRATSLIPFVLNQNPAPALLQGQNATNNLQDLTDQIMNTFYQVLPSNYVSQITGPYYSLQFQAIAETLAQIQITAEMAHLDGSINFTRPEFLWQTVGTLIFPEIDPKVGVPDIPGDVSYRTFLERMIGLLLEGAKLDVQKSGVDLITQATVEVLEKASFQRDPNSAWGFPEQFEFEVTLSDCSVWTDPNTGNTIQGSLGTGFPEDPFRTQKNAEMVLRALKPAHTLYDYLHLFREFFGDQFEDTVSWELNSYYYEDFRKFCTGAKSVTGTGGITLTDRTLFSDPMRDFRNICPGAILEILSGENASGTNGGSDVFTLGQHRVVEVLRMVFGADSSPRAYTTSPSNLSGDAHILEGGEIQDLSQDWSNAQEGEIVTFAAGPNAGSYRLEALLGPTGGPVGAIAGGSSITNVRVAHSLLRLDSRPPVVAVGQTYRVAVDRLGVRVPQAVTGEDVSAQFVL